MYDLPTCLLSIQSLSVYSHILEWDTQKLAGIANLAEESKQDGRLEAASVDV